MSEVDGAARPLALLRGTDLGRALVQVRELVEEVAEVDWASPTWSGFAAFLAAADALGAPTSPDDAAAAFVTALEANGSPSADTFMASGAAPAIADGADRVALAVVRARAMADALRALDGASDEQPLLQVLARERGWLRRRPITRSAGVPVAFLAGEGAWVARVDRAGDDLALARALAALPAPHPLLRRVDPSARTATEAVAAIALDPVPLAAARSFHRLAWTRGGGPWTGVADTLPGHETAHQVVSTCHAAADGYAHARLTAAVFGTSHDEARERIAAALRKSPPSLGSDPTTHRSAPPPSLPSAPIGFAAARVDGPSPRFAAALHAFATVLDAEHGAPFATRSVPFHVPIAPGHRDDDGRWRRRPLYGLMALAKRDGALETREALAARLPAFLEREASGAGLLTRVLRAMLGLPLPLSIRRALIARKPGADRFFPAAQVLTGGGYLSWMRFPPDEVPAVPTFPSAVPSFAVEGRGGAGLSIAPFAGGLAVGLTTSGELGTNDAAERFLHAWLDQLR